MKSNKSCLKGMNIAIAVLGNKGYQFYFGRALNSLFLLDCSNNILKPCPNISKKVASLPRRLIWK